jgi:hypothetical protein
MFKIITYIVKLITRSISIINLIVLNWSFIFGILVCTVAFSDYIFGPNNLYEEIVEVANKIITGEDIDLSPEVPEDPEKDLNRLVPNKTNINL